MRATLTLAGSHLFVKALASLRKKRKWSYTDVSRVLSCSRSTAINLLKDKTTKRVKKRYAKSLEPYLDGEVPWSSSVRNNNAIQALLKEWSEAEEPFKRRILSRKLSNFLSEFFVITTGLEVLSSVRISATQNPIVAAVELYRDGSRAAYTVMVSFDLKDRTKILMSLASGNGSVVFNGIMSYGTLNKISNKVKKL